MGSGDIAPTFSFDCFCQLSYSRRRTTAIWDFAMNENRDACLLARNGTMITKLSVANIIQTVEADLRKYRDGQKTRAMRKDYKKEGLPTKFLPTVKKTCFLPKHLNGAKDVTEVLSRAIKNIEAGRTLDDPSRDLMYSDKSLLEEALNEAKQV